MNDAPVKGGDEQMAVTELIGSVAANSSAANISGSSIVGKEDFLKLLVTQLQKSGSAQSIGKHGVYGPAGPVQFPGTAHKRQ